MVRQDKPLSSRECKERLLKILVDFDEFCKKSELRYFLAWGTLIGAIRHNGFIPWDDDIDVAMPREDYQKLIELSKEWNIPYEFLCYEKGEEYPFYFGKFSDKKTILENKYVRDVADMGLYIDVYPIDDIKIEQPDITSYEKRLTNNELLQKFASMKKFWPAGKPLKTIVKYILFVYARSKGTAYFERQRDELIAKKAPEEAVATQCVSGNFVLQKKWFSETISIPFEEYAFSCPIGYDDYLRVLYGDYIKLPPEEQRVSQHDYEAYCRK